MVRSIPVSTTPLELRAAADESHVRRYQLVLKKQKRGYNSHSTGAIYHVAGGNA